MNEIMQFCVQWRNPANEAVLTAAIAVMEDMTCEVVGVDSGTDYVMRKIAVRAANCEDGTLKVNGKAVLPESYCTKWRGVLKKPLSPQQAARDYMIVCNVVRGEGTYLGYLEEVAKAFGCEVPKEVGDFIRVDMLAPETTALMFQSYGCQSAITHGVWSVSSMVKVERDLFSMQEAA